MASPVKSLIAKGALGLAGLVAVVLVVSLVLWKQWITGEHFLQSGMPECPHDWKTFAVAESQHGVAWSASFQQGLTVPGRTTSIPEFHDCQRLIVDGQYGPLAAVFVSFQLDSLIGLLGSQKKQGPYLDSTLKLSQAYTVAEVFQQDGPDYEPLGMQPGFNCLHLYSAAGVLKARMVPVGQEEARCGQPFDPRSGEGKELDVTITTLTGYKVGDYPAVARWDRDPVTGLAYIGLKCDAIEWCEIGTRNPSERYSPGTSAGPTTDDRVWKIKGWYDEQLLAVPNQAGDGLDVGPARAHVFPHPALKDVTTYDERWVTTGYIALTAESEQYKNTLNLDPTLPNVEGNALNVIEMCHGTRSGCLIPDGYEFPSGTCGWLNGLWSRFHARYWARITSAVDKSVAYRCVIRRDHSTVDVDWVPGTARWRWMPLDETIWEECIKGCCQVESGNS